MLPSDENLRADLIAANTRGGGLLEWDALRAITQSKRVSAATASDLRKTSAGRKLLAKIQKTLARGEAKRSRVFLAHSFHKTDALLVKALRKELRAKALKVVTGEKPAPRSVSAKVLDRIDSTWPFIALFTASPRTGRPSAWVVSELGYAARKPRVVLLESSLDEREIGGIQGDIEYISFTRKAFITAFRRAAESALSES